MENYGFLLLCSHLGNPDRKPLTTAQLRLLARRVMDCGPFSEGELTEKTLLELGFSPEGAQHILALLEDQALLERYLQKAKARRCTPIQRRDLRYPAAVRKKLGLDSPGCLWAKGALELLDRPKVAAVGCRVLRPENRDFAYEAARQGFVLVSGNASGADQAAQAGCLDSGGQVISVVADALHSHLEQPNVLYLSEEDYDMPFSPLRALRRNRVIHALGQVVLVAQSRAGQGGTWNGTARKLKNRWTPVRVLDDGSEGAQALVQLGAAHSGGTIAGSEPAFPQGAEFSGTVAPVCRKRPIVPEGRRRK